MSQEVDQIILEVIDESLSVLGDKGREAIYYFLEREYLISRKDIPQNLKTFHECLHLVFGVGANILEKYIIENLRKRVNVELKLDYHVLDFAETVKKIKLEIKK